MPKLIPKNRISRKIFNRIVELLKSTNLPHIDVARKAGCSTAATVTMIAKGTHYYQTGKLRVVKGPRLKKNLEGRRTRGYKVVVKPYLPTPEEIAAICAEIRAAWDEERVDGWHPPVYSERDLIGC